MAEETQEQEIQLKCIYGNKVKLQNLRTLETFEFELVNYNQEKLSENKISNYTKVGRAVWAKHEGDIVDIEMPGQGLDQYKIVEIDHAS